jgi:hypothetical protein
MLTNQIDPLVVRKTLALNVMPSISMDISRILVLMDISDGNEYI